MDELPAISTQGLTKRYRGGQLAVDGLELTVPRGSVFGFLGPNGSGKTTTIRMLMGLIEPASGTARVLGEPMPRAVRTVLPRGRGPHRGPALCGFLSGRDNLLRFDSSDPTADPAPAVPASARRWTWSASRRRRPGRPAPTRSA